MVTIQGEHNTALCFTDKVAKYYQNEGFRARCGNARFQIDDAIRQMKAAGNTKEIPGTGRNGASPPPSSRRLRRRAGRSNISTKLVKRKLI